MKTDNIESLRADLALANNAISTLSAELTRLNEALAAVAQASNQHADVLQRDSAWTAKAIDAVYEGLNANATAGNRMFSDIIERLEVVEAKTSRWGDPRKAAAAEDRRPVSRNFSQMNLDSQTGAYSEFEPSRHGARHQIGNPDQSTPAPPVSRNWGDWGKRRGL